MFKVIVIFFVVYMLWLDWKKPEYGIFTTLLLISLGPIIDHTLTSSLKFISILLVLLIEFIHVKKLSPIYYVLMIFIIIKEFISSYFGGGMDSFSLAIYYYCVIPSITYFSYLQIRNKGIDFLSHFKIYIVISLAIQFYRVLFDYSFFGFLEFNYNLDQYSDLLVAGSEMFRPSNLEGSIIYSIELAVFLGLLVIREGINKRNFWLLVIGLIGLILTLSRSGLLIFLVSVMYYLFKKKQISLAAIIIVVVSVMSIYLGFLDRLTEMFDSNSETYATRTDSMKSALKIIRSFSFSDFVFGLGSGHANYSADGDTELHYYVENYYLATLIDSGIVGLMVVIGFSLKSILSSLKTNPAFVILLVSIIATNFMSCNLTGYTVEIIFLYLCFVLLIPNVSLNSKHTNC